MFSTDSMKGLGYNTESLIGVAMVYVAHPKIFFWDKVMVNREVVLGCETKCGSFQTEIGENIEHGDGNHLKPMVVC
ncbi:hypothetical protein VNO78_10143 [Psophocarpus tetragonolobus]|uniref:Uncharacterized protein n=1 Tax=Psophocarpus tetragonolobus TaxID=3891 RepID=A0AAN9SJC3_PSOTE